jgi:predicted permease
MGTLDYPEGVDLTIMLAYYAAALTVYAIALATGLLLFRLPLQEAALFGMGSTFSNSVLLGIPLVFLAFEEQGVLPLMLIISVHPLILITVSTILIEVGRGSAGAERTNWAAIGLAAVLSLLKNPIIVGMLVGVLYGLTGFGFHPIAERFIEFLGRAAAPCALFALGASLTRYRIAGDLPQVGVMAAFKLLLMPTLVWVSTHYVFPIEPLWGAIATINAAMASGANVFVLASRYDIFVARAASLVLISTALAAISAAVLLTWFAVGG